MATSKAHTNTEIVDLLNSVAAAYQIKDANKNRFKIVAYQRAATAVEHLSSEAKDLWDDGKLEQVAGIGESIAKSLGEIFEKGKSKHLGKVLSGIPPAVFELIKISGVGPKRAFKLAKELNLRDAGSAVEKLKSAIKSGKVAAIDGMGELTAKEIGASIKESAGRTKRFLLPYAIELSEEIKKWIEKEKSVEKVEVLGSLRRKSATVGDLDFAAATTNSQRTLNHFTKYPKATRTLEKGDRTASIIVPGNRQIDLMVETPDAFGALLQHFTGSKHHNIKLRETALKRGYSLSDYGAKKIHRLPSIDQGDKLDRKSLSSLSKGKQSKLRKFKTEEELYKFLGMEWIPPELREDVGEIKAALSGKLPKLIESSDIKGDLQIHSDFDIETSHDLGESSMEGILKRAEQLNYQYVAFTEHNPSKSKHKPEEIVEILKRKREAIDKLNEKSFDFAQDDKRYKKSEQPLSRVYAFNSLEIDMLPKGGLPVPDAGLATLDFALVSIHSSFKHSRSVQTKRVLDSLAHPKAKIFAHPTGRKLNHREGVNLDWDAIFDFCLVNNKWIEINAEPMRLDLPDYLVREAVKLGVKLTLGTDAHNIDMMDNMKWGVNVARRGWAEKKDIVNTLSLGEFERLLSQD